MNCGRGTWLAVVGTLGVMCGTVAAQAQTSWKLKQTLPVGGEGGWDYVTVDAATHRVFVTRGTHTQVVDEMTGKVVGDIAGQVRSHGVALAPKFNRGFITDGGGTGNIVVFDLTTYAVLGKLAALPDADGIIYDAGINRVLAVSGDSGALLAFPADIDLKSKIDAPIALGGSPEFLAADGTGKVYINMQDKDVVAVVDVAARKVVARWPVAPGGAPVGLAIDMEHHRLLIGCRKPQKLVVMSTVDGKVLGSVPIGAGVDATTYGGGQAFASCRDGSMTVAGDVGGMFAVEQTVATAVGSRTMGLDAKTQRVYLPGALFEEPVAGSTARPKMKMGSYMLLEVTPQ